MQPYSQPSHPLVEPGIPPGTGKGFPVKFPKCSASGTLKGNPPQSPIPLQFPNSPEAVATSHQQPQPPSPAHPVSLPAPTEQFPPRNCHHHPPRRSRDASAGVGQPPLPPCMPRISPSSQTCVMCAKFPGPGCTPDPLRGALQASAVTPGWGSSGTPHGPPAGGLCPQHPATHVV